MNIVEYIKETRSEMAHVSWPTRRQAVIYTVVVIAISIIVGVLLGVFDSAFALLMKQLLVQ
jgi:preprotein translocase subunit SecE